MSSCEDKVLEYNKDKICYVFISVSGIEPHYICWDSFIHSAKKMPQIEAVIKHLVPEKTRIVLDTIIGGNYLAERLNAANYNVSIPV